MLSRWRVAVNQVYARGIRTKGGVTRSLSREDEDTLLKQLEVQYQQAKARLAKEEESQRATGANFVVKEPPQPQPTPTKLLDKHTSSLWEGVLTEDERQKLAVHGIKTLEELQQASQEADTDLNRPPYPSLEKLRPKYQLAYELHQSIPRRLALKGFKRSS